MNRAFIVDQAKIRLDLWLVQKIPELTRSRIQTLIQEGYIKKNDSLVRPSVKLQLGDKITIEIPETKPLDLQAEAIPLDILYEDDQIIILNKSAGLVVHPGAGQTQGTLVNALLHHCKDSLSGIGGIERPGIVHRLDKETSGILLVAKTDKAHQSLSHQFKNRSIQKFYQALVHSHPKQIRGEIYAPIGRHPIQRKKMAIIKRGKPALTRFYLVEKFKKASLLECQILTGRTHQIRVHLTSIGCPIWGDKFYGKFADKAPRQMLHAARLEFQHPSSGKEMRVVAPLPKDFTMILEQLRHEFD